MNGAIDELDPDELRAAEYALGTLRGAERARFEADLAKRPNLQGLVAAWEDRFVTLNELTPLQTPRPEVWRRIERGVGIDQKARMKVRHRAIPPPPAFWRRWWESLVFWRLAGMVGTAAALALWLGVLAPPPALIAVLQPTNGGMAPAFAVRLPVAWHPGRVTPADPPTPPAGSAYELWLLDPAGTPRSLGLLPTGRVVPITPQSLPADIVVPGATMAVSLEPPDGSPTGQPTGRVVMTGMIVEAR